MPGLPVEIAGRASRKFSPFKALRRSAALLRTHTCGQLRAGQSARKSRSAAGSTRNRDQGGIVFIDLRDRYGKTQVVFDPEGGPEAAGAGQQAADGGRRAA